MKTTTFIAAAFLLIPSVSFAAQVQVYPTFTATHGGSKFAKDTTVCIQHADMTKECAESVPTFSTPINQPYQILFTPPAGYSYVADSNCAGTPTTDDLIVCHVDYADGAPIVVAPASQVVAPAPTIQPIETIPTLQVYNPQTSFSPMIPKEIIPAPMFSSAAPTVQMTVSSGLSCIQSEAVLAVLSAFGVDSSMISTVRKILEPRGCII